MTRVASGWYVAWSEQVQRRTQSPPPRRGRATDVGACLVVPCQRSVQKGRFPLLFPANRRGIRDVAAKRFRLRRRHWPPGQQRLERRAQIVRRHVLTRLAEVGIGVVDAAAIPDGAAAIDEDN